MEDLRDRLVVILEKNGFDLSGKSQEWLTELAAICQEKLPTLNQIVTLSDFFFQEVTEYDEKGVRKQFAKEDSVLWIKTAQAAMEETMDWHRDVLKAAFQAKGEEKELKLGKLVNPSRLALTGKSVGPGFFELAELLSKETCLQRMAKALEFVNQLEDSAS